MPRLSTPIPALFLALCFAAPAAADEVRLRNGDRLSGTVVSLAGGTLIFETPHGALTIPWDTVTALAVTEPILVTEGAAAPASLTLAIDPASGRTRLEPGGPIALDAIVALARPADLSFRYNGGANAGFVTSGGNSSVNSLRLDGDLQARDPNDRLNVSAAINRAEDRGVETANNWSTALKYDRFVTTRFFVNGNAIVTNDRFRDLDLRTALGAGAGYQILDSAAIMLKADGGIGFVSENLASQPDDRYAAVRESATLEAFVVPGRLQIFHQHDGYFGVTGDDNLFVRTQNGVRVVVGAGFVTTLRLDLDYDRSPAPGRVPTDRTFALTLGYRF